jgi:hypothetical protein
MTAMVMMRINSWKYPHPIDLFRGFLLNAYVLLSTSSVLLMIGLA